MKTLKNRMDQRKSKEAAHKGFRGIVLWTPKSVLHFLRSIQPAKTLLTYLLLAVVVGSASLIAYAQSNAPALNDASVIQRPGLSISGAVRMEGLAIESLRGGLEGVEIYMDFLPTDMRIDSVDAVDTAIPPTETPKFPKLIAVTDENGEYESGLIDFHDEGEIHVWAVKEGFQFEPEVDVWFHAYGYEEHESGFIAIPDADITITPTPWATNTPTPLSGVLIFGIVQLDSTVDNSIGGLDGVEIHMAFASYPGSVVAVTDRNGAYESDFISIPVDETIRVWAEKDGYRFVPDEEIWKFYAGFYQERQINFLAYPDHVTVTPIPPTFTPTNTALPPGVIVFGEVLLSDSSLDRNEQGVANVEIYLALASYQGNVVDTTDSDGRYSSAYIYIPGDEMIRVWPVKEGYRFEPQEEVWRHYAGHEIREINFLAYPDDSTVTPITPTFTPTSTGTPEITPITPTLTSTPDVTPITPTFTPTPTVTATPDIEPGLRIYGKVVLSADETESSALGLGEVDIYMSVDGSGYESVALTNENGYFDSGIISLSGEHQIIVWAVKDGYLIEPEAHRWTHLEGYEVHRCDFIAEPTKPGLIVNGYVWKQDDSSDPQNLTGVRDVEILMSISGDNMGVVAITDKNGFYESDFIAFEGDADIHIWPVKRGFTFESRMNTWHHYHGYEERRVDFLAVPEETGLVISGSVLWEDPNSPTNEPEGLEGVEIYIKKLFIVPPPADATAEAAQLIAITDKNGQYRSGFLSLSGTYEIEVRAYKANYTFDPDACRWINDFGFEEHQCDFDAYPKGIIPTPVPTSTPIVILPDTVFVDVSRDHPDAKYIQYLYDQGLVSGCTTVGDPRFCPDDSLGRDEVTVILVRAEHPEELGYIPPERDSVPFEDLPGIVEVDEKQDPSEAQELDWRLKWVGEAWDLKLTVGCSAEPLLFCPNEEVTRGQMLTFAVKLRNGQDFVPPEPAEDPFTDVPRYLPNGVSNWVAKWAAQGLTDEIVQNCGTSMDEMFFFPDKAVTRAEMACMVYHALTNE
jgi:hypothetical protein